MASSDYLIELENRNIRLTTPLSGSSRLYFLNMTVREELCRPFDMTLECISQDSDIKLQDLLGHDVTVELDLKEDGEPRYFHGFVTRFAYQGHFEGFFKYKATIRPWLWFLTRTTDSRIFQEQTAVEIIKAVLNDNGFTDIDDQLIEAYRARTYCVQYRETDFDFITRLMEEEGIYYFFRHEQNKHTLVLCDSYSSHGKYAGYETLKYFPPDYTYRRDEDHVFHWESFGEVQPGRVVLDDFDFAKSTTDLEARGTASGADHPHSDGEIFDYPGLYHEVSDGETYARVRIEELTAQHLRARSRGNVRGLATGYFYTLSQLERDDENIEYLVTAATHRLKLIESTGPGHGEQGAQADPGARAAQSGDTAATTLAEPVGIEDSYGSEFEVLDANVPFHPPRMTSKPTIRGPQTAIVCGKSGEEIWTDEFGRVKVQFHWDRQGNKDENTTCWIRVAQLWAGKSWGGMFIPRIGMEVLVDFLEGDPDRPIITGTVYNDQNQPPYSLPDEATKATVKSDSSKGGGGYNELRFEDKKDEEEVYFQTEKDYNAVVKNNETRRVGFDKMDAGDQTIEIYNNRTTTIDQGNDTLTINTGNRETTISQGSDTLTISLGDQTTEVSAGSSSLSAGMEIELKVGASSIKIDNTTIKLKATMIEIEADAMLTASGAIAEVTADGILTLKGGLTKIG